MGALHFEFPKVRSSLVNEIPKLRLRAVSRYTFLHPYALHLPIEKGVDWQKYADALSHFALAVIYIWFGGLKFFGASPATELVTATVSWMPPQILLPLLGAWETGIGIGFLIPSLERYALGFLFIHLMATTMPLILFPKLCFVCFMVPSMTGQYIIKNLSLLSVGVGILMRRRARLNGIRTTRIEWAHRK